MEYITLIGAFIALIVVARLGLMSIRFIRSIESIGREFKRRL